METKTLPCPDGRWRRRKRLNSSDRLPVRGKLLGRARAIRSEPPWRRKLPVCRQDCFCGKARGPSQLGRRPGYFPTAVAQGRKTQAPLLSQQGKVKTGLRPQLASTSWSFRELSGTHWAWMRPGEQAELTPKPQRDEAIGGLGRPLGAEVSEKWILRPGLLHPSGKGSILQVCLVKSWVEALLLEKSGSLLRVARTPHWTYSAVSFLLRPISLLRAAHGFPEHHTRPSAMPSE